MFKPILYRENVSVVMPRKFLEESAYAEALEAFVVVCTDCLLINRENRTIFLAKRKSKPMSDWWFIGGRSFRGEEEIIAVRRCLKRETGLDINPDRFVFLTMKRYFFRNRQQEPQDTGCDSLCYIFGVYVSKEEIALANKNLDPEEYDTEIGLKEFSAKELFKKRVFSSIIDIYEYIFPKAVVRIPITTYEEQDWIVLWSSYKTFKCSRIRLLNKPEIPEHRLIDRIPNSKKLQALLLLNIERSLALGDVGSWSKLSVMLGVTLLMCMEDLRGFHVTHYYTVFPDGTVEHWSMIDPTKWQERRHVKWQEKRQFFKTVKWDEGHYENLAIPLEQVD